MSQTAVMRHIVTAILGLVLVLSACGGGATGDSPAPDGSTTTPGSIAATDAPGTGSESAVTTTTGPERDASSPSGVDGPAAPDFSLVLGDGTTFTLSEGAKPVYMVFWAEW